NYAYVAENTRWTGSNLLGALEIFDVSTPTKPIRVGTFDTEGAATSVDLSGGYAYLADGVTDLLVLDVSDPAHPRRIGGYDTDERKFGAEFSGPATYVQVDGNVLYSAGDNGFHVRDVSTPSAPVRLSGFIGVRPYALRVSGGYCYAAFWSMFANSFSLFVLDASDPTNLTLVANTYLLSWPQSIQVVGRRVYLATPNLLVYEVW